MNLEDELEQSANIAEDLEQQQNYPRTTTSKPDNKSSSSNHHDQLPSVEEYKTHFSPRSSNKLRISSSTTKPDPLGVEASSMDHYEDAEKDGLLLSSGDDDDDDDDDDDQPSPKRRYVVVNPWWKYCAIVTFLLLVIVIVTGFTIASDNQPQASSWIRDSDRLRQIQQYLVDQGISTTANLVDATTSPQHLAAQWMAHGDDLQLAVPTSSNSNSNNALEFQERYALAVLYYATDGPNWALATNWLGAKHVCTWYEAYTMDSNLADLDGESVTMGVHGCKLDEQKELVPVGIYLPNNGLKGTLPEELKVLDRMEVMSFQFNPELIGTLPQGLSNMDNLRHLALQWCSLTGSLPTWIGDFASLVYLGLGNNQLTGQVPLEIAQLTDLRVLGLDDNAGLSANIDLFHSFSNINSLYLEDNNITGTLSEALMTSWPQLQELDLSNNEIGGSLPENFFNHDNSLQVVDLHGNQLQGPFPRTIRQNGLLEFLALHDNRLTGNLPHDLNQLSALTHLDLSKNSLVGTIPNALAPLTGLKYLFLGQNHFEAGRIPGFLVELTNLVDLSLKDASLTGELPGYLSYLSKLEFLDLHHNSLMGTVPATIGHLTHLKHLLLKGNQLTGTLPTELSQLTDLDVLLLQQNNLVGNADVICKSKGTVDPAMFVSDCLAGELACSCCSYCCSDTDPTCNPGNWDGNLDPIWEYGYRRGRYSYEMVGPETLSPP